MKRQVKDFAVVLVVDIKKYIYIFIFYFFQDKDVARLQDFQELEVVLEKAEGLSLFSGAGGLTDKPCYNMKASRLTYQCCHGELEASPHIGLLQLPPSDLNLLPAQVPYSSFVWLWHVASFITRNCFLKFCIFCPPLAHLLFLSAQPVSKQLLMHGILDCAQKYLGPSLSLFFSLLRLHFVPRLQHDNRETSVCLPYRQDLNGILQQPYMDKSLYWLWTLIIRETV